MPILKISYWDQFVRKKEIRGTRSMEEFVKNMKNRSGLLGDPRAQDSL
jgi:hypothetical protein